MCLNFQDIVETLPQGVFTIDTDWRITSFNQSAETITGHKRGHVIGRHCWDIFKADQCRRKCPLELSMNTGETRMDQEVSIFNRNGERQTLLVNVNVLRDGKGQVTGALETFRVVRIENKVLKQASVLDAQLTGIIGRSEAIVSALERLPDIAASNANVLIDGESGTGKELLAKAIHNLSPNRKQPFVAVNCAALAESLLESELFGHEKGAFTSADRSKPGRFEMARGGTLFLDEIGEMKPELQVKLLRVIEQREFERVGGTQPISLDARIISATNQELGLAMQQGRFREDLFFRLRTVPMTLPPLRDRIEDIPLLVDEFIKTFNRRYNKNVRSIDPKALKMLSEYCWPGNVRELERCLEHAFVFVKGPVIFAHYLPKFHDSIPNRSDVSIPSGNIFGRKAKLTRSILIQALEKSGGNRKEAAAMLGISRTSIWRYMKRHSLL
ncbi:MAG: PAS domain-containing protein [Desulfobacteraceae bacterium]|nr:PAS domain-containing protein [Desulfobacteraceae bacterium]